MLSEFLLYFPEASHPDWPRLAAEARELAQQLRPGLEPPRTGPAEWQRRAQSWRTAAKNYFDNRALANQGREDLRPLYFIWTTHRPCNFLCEYCDDHRGAKYPELPAEGALDTQQGIQLLQIMRSRTPSVYFSGGEPTMRKDLPELARAARDLGYFPLVVNTNGSAIDRVLKRPSWSTWLADMDIIVVSLDALDLGLLQDMWRYRHPEQVVRNLLLLRELSREMRFKLMVNTVIQPGRIHEARAVLDFANDLGLWFCPVPQNRGPGIDPALLEDPDYASLVETILHRKRAGYRIIGSERMNRRLLNAGPKDCRNTLKPHVDHDGRLFWPCKASVNTPPEMLNVLDFADVDTLYEHGRARIDPTGFHGPGPGQCGADCVWAQNYTTDEYAYGLRHPGALFEAMLGFTQRS